MDRVTNIKEGRIIFEIISLNKLQDPTWYMVSSALTSTYMATKKERKKRTPQDRVSSSLEESSVSGPTLLGKM